MKCETCKYAIFDEKFGEYKCSKLYHVVQNVAVCEHYSVGTPAISKDNPDYISDEE